MLPFSRALTELCNFNYFNIPHLFQHGKCVCSASAVTEYCLALSHSRGKSQATAQRATSKIASAVERSVARQ